MFSSIKEKVSKLFTSFGTKRKLAALLLAILPFLTDNPSFTPILPVIETIAGILGFGGLFHAVISKTLTQYKSVSVASVFAVLLALSENIDYLKPFNPLILLVGGWFGAFATGVTAAEKKDK